VLSEAKLLIEYAYPLRNQSSLLVRMSETAKSRPPVATVYEVAALQINAIYGSRASSKGQRQLRRPNGTVIAADAVGALRPPATRRYSPNKTQITTGKEKAVFEDDDTSPEEIRLDIIHDSDSLDSVWEDLLESRELAGSNNRLQSLALFPSSSPNFIGESIFRGLSHAH
jgi:hypothetical protein